MLYYLTVALALGCLCICGMPSCIATPVEVVYTGEGCDCPTQLGYQLNVPNPPKPKKYLGGEYGYRIDKPVQSKAKITYSFDFTVEEPRTPAPPKQKPAKLYAKVDRITVNKPDCVAKHTTSCGCDSCGNSKPRYVRQSPTVERAQSACKCRQLPCTCAQPLLARLIFLPLTSINSYSNSDSSNADLDKSPNAITRRRRDTQARRTPATGFFRERLLRSQQERPMRSVKLYHKDIEAQKKLGFFGVAKPVVESTDKSKRKTKKTPSVTALPQRPLARWLQQNRKLTKRDIKGEYDLMERERANIDFSAPEIIQFMPEAMDPNFKRGQCHMGCAGRTAVTEPQDSYSSTTTEPQQAAELSSPPPPPEYLNSIPAKRAVSYVNNPFEQYAQQIPTADYKYVDDTQLRTLISTTSVPDPLEQSATPLRFAGDLEAPHSYQTVAASGATPVLSSQHDELLPNARYPVEHVSDSQLDSIISGIVYQHPDFVDASSHYGGGLIDPEPLQKKQTLDFLKKLIGGRLGGFGFDAGSDSESAIGADYSTAPAQTYGYNSRTHNGYSIDTYSAPPITDYLRAYF